MRGRREVVEHRREVASGLFVLPCTGHEHRNLDLRYEHERVDLVADVGGVEGVVVDLGGEIGVLQPEELVLGAHLVAFVGLLLRPFLAVHLGLTHTFGGPRHREPGVQNSTRVESRSIAVVEHRDGRDGDQARRLGRCHEQLADSGIRDADHADLVVEDPVLSGNRFDHVVAVDELSFLEEAIAATGTSSAPHVHSHVGVTEGVEEQTERGVGRITRRVARVLDDGGVGAVLDRSGKHHVGRQQRAVANLDVAEALADRLLVIERLIRDLVGAVHADDWCGHRAVRRGDSVIAGFDASEEQGTVLVDQTRGDFDSRLVQHDQFVVRQGAGDGDLANSGRSIEVGECCFDGHGGSGRRGRGGGGRRVRRTVVASTRCDDERRSESERGETPIPGHVEPPLTNEFVDLIRL